MAVLIDELVNSQPEKEGDLLKVIAHVKAKQAER